MRVMMDGVLCCVRLVCRKEQGGTIHGPSPRMVYPNPNPNTHLYACPGVVVRQGVGNWCVFFL